MVSLSDIPVAQALTGLLNLGSGTLSGNGETAQWQFTSRLRQKLKVARSGGADAVVGAAESRTISDIVSYYNLYYSMPEIRMVINPKSVQFSQPKRWTKKDTRDGSVFFHFTNRKGQNNDILTMSFQGNTGNIDLRNDLTLPREQGTPGLSKLKTWHNLYQLTREPMLLPDNSLNAFTITYNSQLLPVPIKFTGFFNQVLEFTESADKPNSRDYSFEFTVTSTTPDLDDYIAEIAIIADAAPQSASDASSLFGDSIKGTFDE